MLYRNLATFKNKDDFIGTIRKRTFDYEIKHHGCAQVIVQTFLETLGIENLLLSMASSHFAGGLALTGNNCGALIGGMMVFGLAFGRKDITEGMPAILKGIKPSRQLIRYFKGKYSNVNCRDLTGTDLAAPELAQVYFDSGGLERCASIMADVAGFVGDVIYEEYLRVKAENGLEGR
jgi:C_GCAxxG_C_C family probable redox protein